MGKKVDLAAELRPLMAIIAAHQDQLRLSDKEASVEEAQLDAVLSEQLDKLEAAMNAIVCRNLRVTTWIGRVRATAEVYIALYVPKD